MWLVTKRCGKNFLLGDLVTTTIINSNLRVPGLLLFLIIIVPKPDLSFLAPFVELVALTILASSYFRVIGFLSHTIAPFTF
jgi:hypothetical protein